MKSTKWLAAAAAAGVVVAGVTTPAGAQSNALPSAHAITSVYDNVTAFTPAVLADIGSQLGYQTKAVTSDGVQGVLMVTDQGLQMIALPSACDENGCVGLYMLAGFSTINASMQNINAFNDQSFFMKAVSMGQDGTYLARYEICDFGIPAGNIASNFTNFAAIAMSFQSGFVSANTQVKLQNGGSKKESSPIATVAYKPRAPQHENAGAPELSDTVKALKAAGVDFMN